MKTGNTGNNRPSTGKKGIPFPWLVVIMGTLLLMVGNINTNTFGVFFKPIADNFSWNRSVMSGAFAVRSLVAAVCVIPAGYLADKYGPRRILLPCSVLVCTGMMAAARVTHVWQLYLLQGLCIGTGISGFFVCVMATIAKWHSTKRGLALGIAAAGPGLSAIISPPLATKLIEVSGWQFATFVLGLIVAVIGIPASLVMKDPPSQQQALTANGPFTALKLLPQYLKDRAILSLTIMFVLVGTVGFVVQNHLVNYATDIGFSALAAAGMMSASGIAGTIGRLGIGTISDRIGTKKDAVLCCTLLAITFVLLILKAPAMMWLAAVTFGIGYGGSIPLIPALMVERVDVAQLSMATGIASMGIYLGAAIGPWLAGFIFDVSGSYLWALIFSVVASVAALSIILIVPSARRRTV